MGMNHPAASSGVSILANASTYSEEPQLPVIM